MAKLRKIRIGADADGVVGESGPSRKLSKFRGGEEVPFRPRLEKVFVGSFPDDPPPVSNLLADERRALAVFPGGRKEVIRAEGWMALMRLGIELEVDHLIDGVRHRWKRQGNRFVSEGIVKYDPFKAA